MKNFWGSYITYHSWPGCQVIPCSLTPYLLQGMTVRPLPPELLQPKGWIAFAQLYFHVQFSHFVQSLGQVDPLSNSFLLLLSFHVSGSCLPRTLPDVSAPGYAIPFIYNKLFPSPQPGAIMSFLSILFLFSSFIHKTKIIYTANNTTARVKRQPAEWKHIY